MKYLLLSSVLLFSLLGFCQSITQLENSYPFSHVLREDAEGNPLYTLHWNFSAVEETITFAVNVSTNGWVGLGISPNGGMVNSDVAIGWVNDEGEVFFRDRFAFEQSLPPVDPQQDWFIISGRKDNGYTILEFWRKWITCDDRDREIKVDTSRVVFAWNDNSDPSNDLEYHGGTNRGATSLNLLSGVTNPPSGEDPSLVKSFTLAVTNVTIPSDDTTYWCAALEIPQEVQQQKQYIIRFAPKITPHDFQYVHHMLIYLCHRLDETEVGNSAPCDGMVGDTISECRSGSLIAAWAVGGADFIYPEDVAYPLGGPGSSRYVVIEMHYDNPMMHSGVVDSSGIEFFYISQPREQEAGIITLGHHVNNAMIIPPRSDRYDIFGKCGSTCTSQYFPPEGITIFGNLLHTHLVGRGLTFRLLRKTTQCGGLEQLKPIDQNLQYDFNFQQFTVLPEQITVYPGDILLLECNYNSSDREGVVLGGESTRQEMCLTFPVYYPRTALSACFSTPTLEAFFPFAGEFIPEEHREVVFQSLYNTSKVAEAALNQYIDWSPDAALALQESVFRGDLVSFCLSDQGQYNDSREDVLPEIKCLYEPPNICAASGVTNVISRLVMTACFIILFSVFF